MSWLDDLLGKTILQNDEPLPDRKKLNFRSGPDLEIADNPRLESTDVSLQGAASVKAFGDVEAAVASTGLDSDDVRPPVLSDGDFSAYPFATLQAAIDSLPSIFDGHVVTVRLAADETFDGATIPGFFGGGKLRLCAPYALQTITPGVNTGAAGTGTSTTALKKPGAAAAWTPGALRGLLLVIDSGAGSNGDSDAPIVRAIKDNTTDTATFEAIPDLAVGAVFRICLPSVTINKIIAPPDEVTSACLAVLDCGAPIELHGIAVSDVDLQWGVYAARCSSVEAHGLNLEGDASAMFGAIDCDRAALYDSRIADGAIVWMQDCRASIAERIYSDDGEILIEDGGLGSVIVEARNNTANAVKFHGGSRAKAKINATDFTAPALVCDGVGKFETLGLTLTADAGRCIIVSGGGAIDLSGAVLVAGPGALEVQIDGTDYQAGWADAINYLAVTGGITRVITGGSGLQKDISLGFALNSFINGGSGQEYGGTLLLGGPSPTFPGAAFIATASPTQTQIGATEMAYKFTFVQATTANDSMRVEPLPFTSTAIQERFGVNIGGANVALFPPVGKRFYLAGVIQAINAALTWVPGSRMWTTQDPSGNWWIDFT